MFIYHFNRLIRNRVLWGFFAILIAFAFVAVDSIFKRDPAAQSAGTINGKKVPIALFEETARALRSRDREMSTSLMDRLAWEHIAAKLLAAKNGMAASPEEVRGALAEVPAFQGPNGFDINRYRVAVAAQGMVPEQYERIVAQQLALMKSAALVESANWIAPMELDDELASMTDRFTVRAATVSNRFARAELPMEDAALRKYYAENEESFALPDRVSVRYAAFPVTNYLAFVSVPEDDLHDYYDSNINSYTRPGTNENSEGSETIPFDEVRDKILAELQLEEARYCASTSITFAVYGKFSETEDALEAAAGQAGITVKTSPLFGADDSLFWAENSRELAAAAFELDRERADQRYGIVKGENFIYVIAQAEFSEAHTPAFEAVLDELRPRALAKARAEAFQDEIKTLRDDLLKLIEDGKSFSEAAAARKLNVTTSLVYSVNEIQGQSFPNNFSIGYGAMRLKRGELSEALPASTTESLLVFVEDRQPGDALAAEMMRGQLLAGLARRSGQNLFEEWLSWNLKRQEFTPARPLISEDEPPALDEADEEGSDT